MAAETFIGAFMHWTRGEEAPPRYLLFSALTVAAHALGRRVFLNRHCKSATFPAAMMTLLVGPSGLKKSTAMGRALSVLGEAREMLQDPSRVNIIAEKLSTEALWDDLVPLDADGCRCDPERVDAVGLLVTKEMAQTFNNQSYAEGLTAALNRLSEGDVGAFDWEKGRFEPAYLAKSFKKDGNERRYLRNPLIGMLAGTTPTGLRDEMPAHLRSSGFLARVFPVWETETSRERNLMIGRGVRHDDMRRWLVERLVLFAQLEGEAEPTREALEYLNTIWSGSRVTDQDAMIAAFENREEEHTHRIAIVLAADELLSLGVRGKQAHIDIGVEPYRVAWELVSAAKAKLLECYAPIGIKTTTGVEQFILQRLARRTKAKPQEEGYPFKRLRHACYKWGAVRTERLRGALAELEELGRIYRHKKGLSDERVFLVARRPGPWSCSQVATQDRTFVDGLNAQLAEEYEEADQVELERRERDER